MWHRCKDEQMVTDYLADKEEVSQNGSAFVCINATAGKRFPRDRGVTAQTLTINFR
jgi:hypothetical protein